MSTYNHSISKYFISIEISKIDTVCFDSLSSTLQRPFVFKHLAFKDVCQR